MYKLIPSLVFSKKIYYRVSFYTCIKRIVGQKRFKTIRKFKIIFLQINFLLTLLLIFHYIYHIREFFTKIRRGNGIDDIGKHISGHINIIYFDVAGSRITINGGNYTAGTVVVHIRERNTCLCTHRTTNNNLIDVRELIPIFILFHILEQGLKGRAFGDTLIQGFGGNEGPRNESRGGKAYGKSNM